MSAGPQPLERAGGSPAGRIGRVRYVGMLRRADAAAANPLISYGLILALQLRVIWNVWQYKDLTPGDSAGYFLDAAGWAHGLHDDIVWSPLYTDVWGTVLAVTRGNVYAAEMVMRVGSVLIATVLVLALARRLLHPAVALLVAAWWAIVPANYNVLYEVHLFGAIPVLVAALLVARSSSRVSVGAALGLLLASTLLLRNELSIATLILLASIVVFEVRSRRTRRDPAATYLRAYAIPLVIVALLAGGMYWRSHVQGSELRPVINVKHDLNMCQVYAFNFQQRHPARFRGNAFTECAPLMQQTFGRPMPSLLQAAVANPRAIAGFVKWNLQLFPSGVQVALFGATSSGYQPDYPPVEAHRGYALLVSLLVLGLLLGALIVVTRRRRWPWRRPPTPLHPWALLVLAAVAVTTLVVVVTQRPRPEYMYGLTVGLMLLTGASVSTLLQVRGWTQFAGAVAVAVAVALVIALPSQYRRGPRPLHDAVERLHIVRRTLQSPSSVLIARELNFETCSYLAGSFRSCTSPDWGSLQAQLATGMPIGRVLDKARATVIYADAPLLADPSFARLLASPQRYGWRVLSGGSGETGPWRILVRAT